jgi:hypothetical protein
MRSGPLAALVIGRPDLAEAEDCDEVVTNSCEILVPRSNTVTSPGYTEAKALTAGVLVPRAGARSGRPRMQHH